MLGSIQNNYFSGTLNGNDKVIKNVEINGNKVNYLGMIGYVNGGTIYGLTLNNVKVSGFTYVGVFGYTENCKIYGIRMVNELDSNNNTKGSITGDTHVGGLIGNAGSNSEVIEIELDNIYASGTNYVGSLVGHVYNTVKTINNILVKKGRVISTGEGSTAGLVNGASIDYYSNAIVENVSFSTSYALATTNASNKTYHSTNSYTSGGFDPSNIDKIYFYRNALETLFTGDVNNTGYFFDLTDDDKIHLVKAYTRDPIIDEETGETIQPGVCSMYPCTCECGCDCTGAGSLQWITKEECLKGCN